MDRLEWHVGDAGDPGALLAAFLADHGLPVHDLASPSTRDNDSGRADVTGPVVALLVSSAAASAMNGMSPGVVSPVPSVPDLVAVVYQGLTNKTYEGGRYDGSWRAKDWRESWSGERHAAAVEEVRAAIGRGEVYQANVVGHASAAFAGDTETAAFAIATLPGASYGQVLSGDGWRVASGSPECLISVRRGAIASRPIKGTRPRTAAGRRELLASAKERAEHVMIVDLVRNDIAQVAHVGTVSVDELYTLRPWCDLWQAESTVTGRLRPDATLLDVLRALCPAGSVTGAPKRAALDVIAGMEAVGRGPAMGALGWLTRDGLDLGVTIRTAAFADGRVHLWAGGGITHSSDPWAEVAEAAAKSRPIRTLLAAGEN